MTADVWLPLPADEVPGLPDGLSYRLWDGGPDYPADPADCAFYVVPYMKGSEIAVRPLAAMTGVRVVQTLSAGIDHVQPGLGALPTGVRLCNARGVHEASTAELTLALILASLRGIPSFVAGQEKEEWRSGFYPALADKSVLIVGYGSIGAAIEDLPGCVPQASPGWRGWRAPGARLRAAQCIPSPNCPHSSRKPTWWSSPRPSRSRRRAWRAQSSWAA